MALLAVVILVAAGSLALAWHPAMAPIAPPARASFDADLVKRGTQLAALGDCASCHTPEDGRPFSGGRPLATPFGTIYGTNITPDPEAGIGGWSEAAFRRSMRDGIDREGNDLYPAFPYDHFTKLTDEDIKALYAFLMTRDPVNARTPRTELPFPYGFRPLLSGWKLLFLDKGVFRPDPSKGEAWNRGAYLSEALGHCGDCHTPRNRFGAEVAGKHFGGGEAEGWWAPPLNQASPAPVPWTEDALAAYLRSSDPAHGSAAGPMAPVAEGFAQVPEAEARAVATYVASLMGPPSAGRARHVEAIMARTNADIVSRDPGLASGAAIYSGTCAVCHESGGQVPFTVRSLAQHTVLAAPDPRNVIQIVLNGVHPPEGEAGAIMPGFAGTLTGRQIADLLAFLRARFSDQPPWSNIAEQVRAIEQGRSGS